MSAAGTGAGEGVVLDADAPATTLDDGHRPVKVLELSEQDTSLGNGLKDLDINNESRAPESGIPMPLSSSSKPVHPADLVSSNQPDARNGHSQGSVEERNRQTSAGTTDSYDTCDIGEVDSSTSSSVNALEDGDARGESVSRVSVGNYSQTQGIQYRQTKAEDFAYTNSSGPAYFTTIANGRVQELQDSPIIASNSLLPTPASEEITALRMSGRGSVSADPYRTSSSSGSEHDILRQAQATSPSPRSSTSQSTRVPSNLSHDPLHNGETFVDEASSTFQPIPLVELALHESAEDALQQLQSATFGSVSRSKGASTRAQNGHESSDSAGDPFVSAASTSLPHTGDTKQIGRQSTKVAPQSEREDEFAETLATSNPTSNRGNLFHTNGQNSGQQGSPTVPRSPRSSMQKPRGEGSTAASTGHHTSLSSIGYRGPSADSNAPLTAGSPSSAHPFHGHEPPSSSSQTSQSIFAQQQTAAPFSRTVPASESNKSRSVDHSRSPSSREKERSTATTNGKEREKSSRRQLGEWTLGKTLGAGSMGKVKLGVSTVTGDKVSSINSSRTDLSLVGNCL